MTLTHNPFREPDAPSLYQLMVAAGVQIDSHETDMYVPVNATTTKILKDYRERHKLPMTEYQIFVSQIDGKGWYDLPFSFDPAWQARAKAGSKSTTQE
jgi:hypothetical protein